jgi:hypothetical protein
MIICRDIKVIYIAPPKTGTRSVYNILKTNYGGVILTDHLRKVPEEYKDYYTFTTIRNPYDRACSSYYSMCRRDGCDVVKIGKKFNIYMNYFKENNLENTFENFLLCIKENLRKGRFVKASLPQIDFHIHNKIDKLIQFEDLEKNFNTLPFVKQYTKLRVMNKTKTKPYWENLMNDEVVNLINEVYREDFQLLSDHYTMF